MLKSLWYLNFSTLFFFLGVSILNPLVSPYAITLGATPVIVGIVAGTVSIVSLSSKPLGGYLGDRGFKFHAMFIGNIIGIIAVLLYVLSNILGNIWVFALGRAVHGFAMGIFFPSSLALAVDLAPKGRVGESLGWRGMMFSLGNIVGPGIGGFISDNFGFVSAFIFSGIFSFIGSLFVLIVWREIGSVKSEKASERGNYRELLRRSFVSASVSLFLISMAYSGVVTYLPALYKVSGFGQSVFGMYMMFVGIASFIMRVFGGKIADIKGPIPVARVGILILGSSYLALAFNQYPPFSFIVGVVSGLGFGLLIPALQYMALANLPGNIRTMGSSIYTMFFDLGMLSGQLAFGVVAEVRGYEGKFPFIALLPFVSLITVHFPLLRREGNEG